MLQCLLTYGQGPGPVPAKAPTAVISAVMAASTEAVATRRRNSDLTALMSASILIYRRPRGAGLAGWIVRGPRG